MLNLDHYPAIVSHLACYFDYSPKAFFHATRTVNLPSIMREGILPEYCGCIHGAMEIRPPEPTVYLSREPQSNNLHTGLLSNGAAVVVLKISPQAVDWNGVWPDDAMFSAFAQELLFVDADEISETFNAPIEEAQGFLDALTALEAENLANALKPFSRWYLAEHGEISLNLGITPAHIIEARDFTTGGHIDLSVYRDSKHARDWERDFEL